MPLNAKPFILYDNVFRRGSVSATDTDSDSQYNALNVKDERDSTFWKAAAAGTKRVTVDLNEGENPGFETGDMTGWTANDATASNTNPASGTWASRLVASGSDVDGAERDAVSIDPDKLWRIKTKHDVSAYTGGTYRVRVKFYDSDDNLISTTDLTTETAATVGYENTSKSVGPSSLSPDITFPAGTASIAVQDLWDTTPTGTSDMDDVLIYEEIDPDSMFIIGHNLWGANATVSIESSDDDTEAISSWDTRVAGFTPDDNKALAEFFSAPGAQRAWRITMVTANLAPYLGQIVVGPRLAMERHIRGTFDPQPRGQRSAQSRTGPGSALSSDLLGVIAKTTWRFENITASWFTDTFLPAYIEHLEEGRPFVGGWDRTNHAAEVYYMALKQNFELKAEYVPTRRQFGLDVEWRVER